MSEYHQEQHVDGQEGVLVDRGFAWQKCGQ